MNRGWWAVSLAGLAMGFAGCVKAPVSQISPTQTAIVSPSLAAAPAATLPNVTVAATPTQLLPVPPGLIPATVPTQRTAQVATGRSDPFTAVTNRPIATPIRGATPTQSAAASPSVASARSMGEARSQTIATSASVPARSNPASAPAVQSPAPVRQPQAASPSPNPAVLAQSMGEARSQTIAVSGVVQTGDRASAIVQVPNEGSRYVGVGDYLANGRVLVKRIEVGAESDPVVILEQDGIEVIRTVGAGNAAG